MVADKIEPYVTYFSYRLASANKRRIWGLESKQRVYVVIKTKGWYDKDVRQHWDKMAGDCDSERRYEAPRGDTNLVLRVVQPSEKLAADAQFRNTSKV